MTLVDLLAQAVVLMVILAAVSPAGRQLMADCADMNVERLEREDRDAAEAAWWLNQMQPVRA